MTVDTFQSGVLAAPPVLERSLTFPIAPEVDPLAALKSK